MLICGAACHFALVHPMTPATWPRWVDGSKATGCSDCLGVSESGPDHGSKKHTYWGRFSPRKGATPRQTSGCDLIPFNSSQTNWRRLQTTDGTAPGLLTDQESIDRRFLNLPFFSFWVTLFFFVRSFSTNYEAEAYFISFPAYFRICGPSGDFRLAANIRSYLFHSRCDLSGGSTVFSGGVAAAGAEQIHEAVLAGGGDDRGGVHGLGGGHQPQAPCRG